MRKSLPPLSLPSFSSSLSPPTCLSTLPFHYPPPHPPPLPRTCRAVGFGAAHRRRYAPGCRGRLQPGARWSSVVFGRVRPSVRRASSPSLVVSRALIEAACVRACTSCCSVHSFFLPRRPRSTVIHFASFTIPTYVPSFPHPVVSPSVTTSARPRRCGWIWSLGARVSFSALVLRLIG